MKPADFLKSKFIDLLLNYIIPVLPGFLALTVFAPKYFLYYLIALVYSLSSITMFMLGKYSRYPYTFHLIHILITIISLIMPPLQIFAIPYFYNIAKKNIQLYVTN